MRSFTSSSSSSRSCSCGRGSILSQCPSRGRETFHRLKPDLREVSRSSFAEGLRRESGHDALSDGRGTNRSSHFPSMPLSREAPWHGPCPCGRIRLSPGSCTCPAGRGSGGRARRPARAPVSRAEELQVLTEGKADALLAAAEPDEVALVHEPCPATRSGTAACGRAGYIPPRPRRAPGPSEELLQPLLEVVHGFSLRDDSLISGQKQRKLVKRERLEGRLAITPRHAKQHLRDFRCRRSSRTRLSSPKRSMTRSCDSINGSIASSTAPA